jgi:hypothetical protein
LPAVVKSLDEAILARSIYLVLDAYKALGGNETVAKGPDMRTTILQRLKSQFAGQASFA